MRWRIRFANRRHRNRRAPAYGRTDAVIVILKQSLGPSQPAVGPATAIPTLRSWIGAASGWDIARVGLRYTAPEGFGSEVPELDTHRMPGGLYVVATPIGNLEDISERARTVMRNVDAVLAEDTRRTRVLLERHAISTPVRAFHEHNEREQTPRIVARMREGQRYALVSDAGTPLVSDPGFVLVRAARSHDVPVHCVPGPSAVTAALSVAGLPTDRFTFEGFLPTRRPRRLRVLEALANETRTMVFYEVPHRVVDSLSDLLLVFGGEREAVVARELTKRFESVVCGSLDRLVTDVRDGAIPARGEFVVIVRGGASRAAGADATDALLEAMLQEGVAVRQAAAIASRLTGRSRNALYRRALALASDHSDAIVAGSRPQP